MKPPPSEVLTLMTAAARWRAGGASWDAVAEKVGRSARTCRSWPVRYAAEWRRLYLEAEDQLLEEAGAEALTFLRHLARTSKDPWVQQNSAKFLYERLCAARVRRAAAPGPPPGKWGPFAAYLEGLSDAEVKAFLHDFLARRLAQPGPAGPVDGGGSGPAVAG
jgi:hypothetical protein